MQRRWPQSGLCETSRTLLDPRQCQQHHLRYGQSQQICMSAPEIMMDDAAAFHAAGMPQDAALMILAFQVLIYILGRIAECIACRTTLSKPPHTVQNQATPDMSQH